MLLSEYGYEDPGLGGDVGSLDAEDIASVMTSFSQPSSSNTTTSLYHAALQSAENYHKPLVKLVSVSKAATERLQVLFEEHGREIASVLRAEFGPEVEHEGSDIVSLPRVQGDSKSKSNKRVAGAHEARGSKVWCTALPVSKCNACVLVLRGKASSPVVHVLGLS